MKKLVSRLPRWRSAQGLVCAGVLLALCVLAFESTRALRHEYASEVAEILAAGDRTAQKLAVRTTDVFDRVNQATLLVKFLKEQGTLPPLASLRKAGVISDELVQFIYVTDPRGFIDDTTAGLSALNVADEDFFKRHLREGDLDVSVAPVWVNPVDGTQGVPVTRRLGNKERFGGLITATVNPAALSVAYARTEARGTAVGVLGADGIFRSRTVDGRLSFGERSDPLRVVKRARIVHETGLPAKSPIDGVYRFLSTAKVEKYPLYAVVAVDATNALANYRHFRTRVLTWSAIVGAGALLAGWLLLILAQRLDASRRRTTKAEAAFRAALEGSLDAIAILEARRNAAGVLEDLTIVDCNTQAAGMVGRDRARLIGASLCDVVPSIRSSGLLRHFEHVVHSQKSRQAEMRGGEAHLAARWLHHQLVPLGDGVALITRDVTDKKTAEQALAALARSDGLTQLSNRRHFEEVLGEARARAMRSSETLVLICIDLDGFKRINDGLGHAAGDEVLVEVARRLRNLLRVTDTISRLGGDEFAVLTERAGSLADVREICERIVDALKAPHALRGGIAHATPSVGAAVFDGDEPCESLCSRADAAMYRAKTSGKSRYVMASVPLRASAAPAVVTA